MPNFLTRLVGGRPAVPETKTAQMLMAIRELGAPDWTRRSFPALAQEGYMRNPVVHRCVRLIAESATRVPLAAREDGRRLAEHPLLTLLARPNPRQSGGELLEASYAYLQTAGNAYLSAAVAEGEVKGLYGLRPDRMAAVAAATAMPRPMPIRRAGARRSCGWIPRRCQRAAHGAVPSAR